MTDTIVYSFRDFEHDVDELIAQLEDVEFDLIVGINRGGCIPAVVLSHALKTPCVQLNHSTRDGFMQGELSNFMTSIKQYNRVLFVDDIIDGGSSMKEIISVAEYYLQYCAVATLLYNIDTQFRNYADHYYGTAFSRKQETRYFDFWWELYR